MGVPHSYCLEYVQLVGGPRDGLVCEASALFDQIVVRWAAPDGPWWSRWLPSSTRGGKAIYRRSSEDRLVFEFAMEGP